MRVGQRSIPGSQSLSAVTSARPFVSSSEVTMSRILTPAGELPFHFHIEVRSLEKEMPLSIADEIVSV